MIELQCPIGSLTLPLFIMVEPDGPAPVEDYIEDRIDLSSYLAPSPDTSFLIRVEGDSMLDAGIHRDDLLVVERGDVANDGDIVAGLLDGEFTLRQYHRSGSELRLVSGHRTDPPEVFTVWGIVRFVIHRL